MQIHFKPILLSKISYLHLFIRLIIFSTLFIFLFYLNIFFYWMQFGEGASSASEYHPIAIIVYDIYPLVIFSALCIFLAFKNYKVQEYGYVKTYAIIIITIIVLYVLRNTILTDLFSS